MRQHIQNLLEFLGASPTPFHCIANARAILETKGFSELKERDSWSSLAPGSYYVVRNDSAMIAFRYNGKPEQEGFRMVGAILTALV